MKLVVGLGNPGPEYARSRHNVGFLVADRVACALGTAFTLRKFAAELAEGRSGQEKVWIMKPQTYMNRSGEAVGPALRYWKLRLDDLVVVHDDIELELFRVQLKIGGGDSGHNGVKSVNAHLGTREYARVRVGVGRPPPLVDPADWVLGPWKKAEEADLAGTVDRAGDAVQLWLELGATKAMNQVNRRARAAE